MNITVSVEIEQGDVDISITVPTVVEHDDQARDGAIQDVAEFARRMVDTAKQAADRLGPAA